MNPLQYKKMDKIKLTEEEKEAILRTAIYNVLYINDLTIGAIGDIGDFIKDKDKRTKTLFKALKKRTHEYRKELEEIIGKDKLAFFSDYNEKMDDSAYNAYVDFRDAIRKILKKNGVEDYKLIASVEVARTMVGYSCLTIENRIKDCLKYNDKIVNLRYYKLSDTQRVIEDFSEWAIRKIKDKDIDLNHDEQCVKAYKTLDKILTDAVIINEAITDAGGYDKQ